MNVPKVKVEVASFLGLHWVHNVLNLKLLGFGVFLLLVRGSLFKNDTAKLP